MRTKPHAKLSHIEWSLSSIVATTLSQGNPFLPERVVTWQALLCRNGGDGVLAKEINAVESGYPDAAFSIFQKTSDGIAGEAIQVGKNIGSSVLMNVYDAVFGCA